MYRGVLPLLFFAAAAQAAEIAGCPVLPADNIWNTPVDRLPLDASSAAYIATVGAGRNLHPDFGAGLYQGAPSGIPFVVVRGSQPRVPVTFEYAAESDPGPYPIPPDAPIEGGAQSRGDRHVLVVDRDNCRLYETFSSYPQADGSWKAGSGAIFDLRSHALRPDGWTSADAAGLPVLPGLVRYEEVAAGEIPHAIRLTVPRTRRAYVWPGRHFASSLREPQYPPMGQRFRLRAGYDISGFPPQARVILTALKKYGMILADNGSSWFITGAPNEGWDNDQLNTLKRVKGAELEAVNVSSLMISPDSGQARPLRAANAASGVFGHVSPGEIVSIFGDGLGPASPVAFRLTAAGRLPTELGGARVLFAGLRAPLLYVSASQVNAIVPFAVSPPEAELAVEFNGREVVKEPVPVAEAAPGLFTADSSGAGQAAILNQDGAPNSPSLPAARDSVVAIYATGAGLTDPPLADGAVVTGEPPRLRLPATVTIGGRPAEVLYSGAAPQAIAGLIQVNARVPASLEPGNQPVTVTIGSSASQPAVSLAVK